MPVYDLSDTSRGVRDCPKCRHTMARLQSYNSVRRNEGYLQDDGTSNNLVTYVLFGWLGVLLKTVYRYTIQPLFSQAVGNARQNRYNRILKLYPNSLICPYCGHILKR